MKVIFERTKLEYVDLHISEEGRNRVTLMRSRVDIKDLHYLRVQDLTKNIVMLDVRDEFPGNMPVYSVGKNTESPQFCLLDNTTLIFFLRYSYLLSIIISA